MVYDNKRQVYAYGVEGHTNKRVVNTNDDVGATNNVVANTYNSGRITTTPGTRRRLQGLHTLNPCNNRAWTHPVG